MLRLGTWCGVGASRGVRARGIAAICDPGFRGCQVKHYGIGARKIRDNCSSNRLRDKCCEWVDGSEVGGGFGTSPSRAGALASFDGDRPSSVLTEERLPPPFTTGKRCANGGGGRGPPRPRCPKRRQKVRSVAEVRVT